MESVRTIVVSDRPPYAEELYNCIHRCPMEGRHHVAIHIQEESQIQLDEGTHEWLNKATNVSEYADSFINISYNVVGRDVVGRDVVGRDVVEVTLWSWLRDLIFGRPDIQTVYVSFTVVVPSSSSSSSSVRTGSVGRREAPDVDTLAQQALCTGVVEDGGLVGENVLGTNIDTPKVDCAREDVDVHEQRV
jgi:hypothetical protein